MNGAIPIFVNGRRVAVPRGAHVRAAVQAADPELALRLDRGEAHATDARGIAVAPSSALAPGAILRVGTPARRPGGEAAPVDADT